MVDCLLFCLFRPNYHGTFTIDCLCIMSSVLQFQQPRFGLTLSSLIGDDWCRLFRVNVSDWLVENIAWPIKMVDRAIEALIRMNLPDVAFNVSQALIATIGNVI